MKTSVHQRFEIMISSLGLTKNSFAIAIGVAPTQIYNIVNGRNAPSFEMLQKIGVKFPEVNFAWLIVNTGQPLNTQPTVEKDELVKRLEALEATLFPNKELSGKEVPKLLTPSKSKKKNPAKN